MGRMKDMEIARQEEVLMREEAAHQTAAFRFDSHRLDTSSHRFSAWMQQDEMETEEQRARDEEFTIRQMRRRLDLLCERERLVQRAIRAWLDGRGDDGEVNRLQSKLWTTRARIMARVISMVRRCR